MLNQLGLDFQARGGGHRLYSHVPTQPGPT